MTWIAILLAALAGAANPAQAGANSELRKALGQLLPAVFIVYLSGLAGTLAISLIARPSLAFTDKFAATPPWAYLGGLLSIAATIAGAALAQRLGSGVFTGVSVTASLVMSVVLDHFGWLGFEVHRLSLPRVIGCGLMIGGLWMVARL